MFQGKRIVITGASMGIGAELAVTLTQQGARVVAAARTVKALDEVVARCKPGAAFAVACDVSKQDDCRALVQAAIEKLGGIDIFVNNAGVSMRARFEDVKDLAIFEQLIRVNYLGAVWCTHFALPHLKKSGGLIVAVSSVTGRIGIPTRTGYSASKHAMQGFFDSLRIELMGSGVDICVVSPGPVSTDIRTRALSATTEVDPEEEGKMMTVAQCNEIILDAMAKRRREVVMGGGAKLALVLRLLAPGLVDRRVAAMLKRIFSVMKRALLVTALVACGKAPALVTDEHIFYSDGLHNENTELLVLDDRILLVFRGGESGQIGSDKAHLNIYASMDQGKTFTRQSELSGGALPGMRDIRDPKLVSFKGRLFLYAISRLPGGHYRDLYGQAWTVRSESTDHGVTWSDPQKTLSDVDPMTGTETFWGMWRFTERNGTLYAVGYDDGDTAVAMFSSPDGVAWTKVSTVVDRYVDVPSETELHFFGANLETAVALVRMDDQGILQDGQTAICVAKDPFTTWSCRRRVETRFDGPTWLARDGRNFVVARKHLPCTAKRTAVYELRGDLTDVNADVQVCELAELQSAGDTAYTGLAALEKNEYLVSWYSSVVPTGGADVPWLVGTYAPSDIWLAHLSFDGVGKDCVAPPAKVACAEGALPSNGTGTLSSGDFLLALAPVIYPSQSILLRTTVTVNAGTVDLHLQPLDAMTKMPVGQQPWDVTGVPLGADGAFSAHFDSEFVPAEAFALLSDPFLTVHDVTLVGRVTGTDRFCGDVRGYAQVLGESPSDRIDLTGSTFGAQRITGSALPEAVSTCATE